MLEAKVFLDEDDMHEGKKMVEYLMRYLMHHGIAGASVFPAAMGYGTKHHLHHARQFGAVDEGPIMILFIDKEEKVRQVLPHVREVLREGFIVTHAVDPV